MTATPPNRVQRWLRFIYVFGSLGFFAGTVTLLGPVRWITRALRDSAFDATVEDYIVRAIILLLIIGVGIAAWILTRPPQRKAAVWGIPLATTLLAGLALAAWMNPAFLRDELAEIDESGRFVFGPYPERADLERLKAEGYDGVITLLHPAVVPFETALLAEEREAAAEVGIPLIEAPMLPWVSDNEDSLERIRDVAESQPGRFYIHCYLGRDRVGVVRRLLASFDPSLQNESVGPSIELAGLDDFERGDLVHFPDSIHVVPYPTDEEWFIVLNGSVENVVSLLDPDNPEDVQWIDREREITDQYQIPLEIMTVPSMPFDPQMALTAARRVQRMERPVLVHAFRTDTPRAEGFVLAYRHGLPPLPPSLYRQPMANGQPRLLGPNIAAGPRPTASEYGAYLWQRGIRGIIYLGSGSDAAVTQDRAIAESTGLEWQTLASDDSALTELLASGGPWYLHGPGLPGIEERLAERFGRELTR